MGQLIRIAAANSRQEDKAIADFVCTGINDERLIGQQVETLTRGGTIQLLDGDYYFDRFSGEDNTALLFGYNEGRARVVNIIGDTENKGYNTHFGAVIHVTKAALDSLPAGETGRVFGGTKKRPDAPGAYYTYTYVNNVNVENIFIFLYDASRPVIGIDCYYMGSSFLKQVGIYTEKYFDDRYLHLKPATPCKGCTGVRSTQSSNDEMARIGFDCVTVGGLYTGFDFVGTDHVIMRTCGGIRCCYGYSFGQMAKTLTLINCHDEGNTHLPRFTGRGQLTNIDFNIERFNADYIPDDPEGNPEPHAQEEIPGGWHGFISYTLQGEAFGLHEFWKEGHGLNMKTVNLKHDFNSRPEHPEYLEEYFDTATGRKLLWNGKYWLDAMGNPAD